MPCDGGPRDEPYDPDASARPLEAYIDHVNVLLCSACRALAEKGFDFDINPELSEWWDRHKAADERREQAKRAAESKRLREIQECQRLESVPLNQLNGEQRELLKTHGYL